MILRIIRLAAVGLVVGSAAGPFASWPPWVASASPWAPGAEEEDGRSVPEASRDATSRVSGAASATGGELVRADTPTTTGREAAGAVVTAGRSERVAAVAAFAAEAFGRSGALRTALALPGERVRLPVAWTTPTLPGERLYRWAPVLGTPGGGGGGAGRARRYEAGAALIAPDSTGVYELEVEAGGARERLEGIRLVVLVPFEAKRGGRIRDYRIGRYPTEGSGRTDRYAPPRGFVEVTRRNQSLRLSDHFRLREFLTHDQRDVWPKYAVVDLRLLEKLELVLDELAVQGVAADRMHVMSGFRTPQYNSRGLNLGRARLSRHQFGDAADVWIDSDADGYMDDLNGDGRRDTRDARVMLRAVERIESRHPDLLGGAGIYADNGVHGPFIHIDVRGHRARW
ncbi:MAG: hypothetical protein ACODAE_05635 [Gemmatimonadota bacterium]